MSEINGVTGFKIANPVVEFLKQILAQAEAGRIATIGVVIATPEGGVTTPYVGGRLLDLFGGAGLLQLEVHAQIKQLQQQHSGKPQIVRATGIPS